MILKAILFSGIIGVWNTMTQTWKVQQVQPITSFDVAGNFDFNVSEISYTYITQKCPK